MSRPHPLAAPTRSLPARPSLTQLKKQAKDLLRSGAAASTTDAQFEIARRYGFASWPKLKAHVEELVAAGNLGQKTGQGFYTYPRSDQATGG